MAKGNIFQGMARGKVGDVVFSRLDGQQVTRVRNRNPRNPNTNGQLYQRAIMATIMQAYSAGKEIFDHSFEGKQVPKGCQQYFMSENAKILRNYIAEDLQSFNMNDIKGRVVPRGATAPTAFNGMVVSKGTYQQLVFTQVGSNSEEGQHISWKLPDAQENEKCSAYAERVGLLAGDLYTFVTFADVLHEMSYQGTTPWGFFYGLTFCFLRLRVKSSFTTNADDAVAAKTMADVFEIETNSPYYKSTFAATLFNALVDPNTCFNVDGPLEIAYSGMIRSREDADLRSNTTLVAGNTTSKSAGIAGSQILPAWEAGATPVGNSSLILEGGNF